MINSAAEERYRSRYVDVFGEITTSASKEKGPTKIRFFLPLSFSLVCLSFSFHDSDGKNVSNRFFPFPFFSFLCRYSFIIIDVLWLGNMTIIESIGSIEKQQRTRWLVYQSDLFALSMSKYNRETEMLRRSRSFSSRRTDQINRAVQWSCRWGGSNRLNDISPLLSR